MDRQDITEPQRRYYEKNRDKVIARSRASAEAREDEVVGYKLQRSYGITLLEYKAMLEKQGGTCAICHLPETATHWRSGKAKRLAVDHDHSTGKVRGLLCQKCNMLLGHFRGDPLAILYGAAEYLVCAL